MCIPLNQAHQNHEETMKCGKGLLCAGEYCTGRLREKCFRIEVRALPQLRDIVATVPKASCAAHGGIEGNSE
jgi:hypothetical protein